MMRRVPFFVSLVLGLACPVTGRAQTTINPDISVIPRFVCETDDGQKLASGRREFSRPDISFQELEVAISSYLNPFARADIVMTLPGPDVEAGKLGIEEAFATVVRGLPFDLNVRFGKYRVEFGKLNLQHPHSWSFITQPLSHQRFLGEEGLNDLGISASVLLPTRDVYSKLSMDLLRGGAIAEAAGIEDTSGKKPAYAAAGRLMGFFVLGDYSDLEAGVSAFTGIHDPYYDDRFWYLNLDFKFKYKPSTYTSLVLQGEFLHNTRRVDQDDDLNQFLDESGNPERRQITTSGVYFFADYQFMKILNVGGRFDWSEAPYHNDDRVLALSAFFGYYPVEETLGVRLQYQNTRNQMPGGALVVNSVALQVLFSLGPHKAHAF